MAKIYVPLEKVKIDPVYQAMMLQLMWIGMSPVLNPEDYNTSIVDTNHIYQDIFPKLILDGIVMEGVDCWIEINTVELEMVNVFDDDDYRLLKDYVLNYYINGDKALIKASHCDVGSRCRTGLTSNDELRLFISQFGNDTFSNVFVENVAISKKFTEYTSDVVI